MSRARTIGRCLRRRAAALIVTVTISVACTTMYVISLTAPGLAQRLGRYRPSDLASGGWWRLISSAVLPQSAWQWAWTVAIGALLFGLLERRIGSLRTGAILLAGHVTPTLLVAAWAALTDRTQVMATPDFGTSCLITAAAGALLWLTRSRLLRLATVIAFLVDAIVNGPVAIVEHILALLLGAVAAAGASRRVRVGRGRTANPSAAGGAHVNAAVCSVVRSQVPTDRLPATPSAAVHGEDV